MRFLLFLIFAAMTFVIGCRQHPTPEEAFKALKDGNSSLVEKYIASGQSLNVKNHEGRNLLMNAIYYERNDIATSLIKRGIDLNYNNRDGGTALTTCVLNNNILIFKALLPYYKDLDQEDTVSYTLLIWASKKGCVEITKELLAHPVKINYETKHGFTALNLASMCKDDKHIEILKMLLGKNASVNLINKLGKTALDYALEVSKENDLPPEEKEKNAEIITILKSYGAKTGTELKSGQVK